MAGQQFYVEPAEKFDRNDIIVFDNQFVVCFWDIRAGVGRVIIALIIDSIVI